MTESDRISVIMYDSDQFFDGKLQLTHCRDPSTKLEFWMGTFLKRQEKRQKNGENAVVPSEKFVTYQNL